MYERKMIAGWGDMDFNAHMRNTAYLDKSADLRMLYFAAHGFPMAEFARLKIGPVVQKDEIAYFREVNLLEQVNVSLALAGISPDGSRWSMRNAFRRSDGKLAATVTSAGGWLDLTRASSWRHRRSCSRSCKRSSAPTIFASSPRASGRADVNARSCARSR